MTALDSAWSSVQKTHWGEAPFEALGAVVVCGAVLTGSVVSELPPDVRLTEAPLKRLSLIVNYKRKTPTVTK